MNIAARPAPTLKPPARVGRVVAVLAASVALHLWVLDRARSELDFDLPAPTTTVQAELFRLPAPIAVGSQPAAAPAPPRRAPRAITPPPVAAVPAPAPAPAPVIVEEPAPAAAPETTDLPIPDDALLPSTTANALPLDPPPPTPIEAVMVSFPKVGRFVSDASYVKGLLRMFGTATVEWKIGADAYEATSVTTDDSGRVLLSLTSSGAVRADIGVAPVRYTEQRLSRAPVAVNFQWDARKVTFSASSSEFPLNDGVQDQLSFIAQLALLAQAFPDRLQPGAPVALEVAGTRNLRIYDFRVTGWEAIRTGVGVIDALKLDRVVVPGSREARIEVWLAPSMRWLAARMRVTNPNEEVIETVLREVHFE
jgi:hypothetical protein